MSPQLRHVGLAELGQGEGGQRPLGHWSLKGSPDAFYSLGRTAESALQAPGWGPPLCYPQGPWCIATVVPFSGSQACQRTLREEQIEGPWAAPGGWAVEAGQGLWGCPVPHPTRASSAQEDSPGHCPGGLSCSSPQAPWAAAEGWCWSPVGGSPEVGKVLLQLQRPHWPPPTPLNFSAVPMAPLPALPPPPRSPFPSTRLP